MSTDLPVGEINIARASVSDAEEILSVQKLAYQSEAQLYGDWSEGWNRPYARFLKSRNMSDRKSVV